MPGKAYPGSGAARGLRGDESERRLASCLNYYHDAAADQCEAAAAAPGFPDAVLDIAVGDADY